MHQQRDPKKEGSTRYLTLHKLKDDRGARDEEYDLDYRPDPFPHYELAAEDVKGDVNEPVNADAGVKGDVNTPATNKVTPTKVVERIRDLYLNSQNTMENIGKLCGVTRQTVDKYTKDLPSRKDKKPDRK